MVAQYVPAYNHANVLMQIAQDGFITVMVGSAEEQICLDLVAWGCVKYGRMVTTKKGEYYISPCLTCWVVAGYKSMFVLRY